VQRKPLWAAGRNTLVGNVLEEARLTNAATFLGYKQVNIEALLAKPPKWYVASSSALKTPDDVKTKLASERRKIISDLKNTPGLKNLECIRQGRVLVVPGDWSLRPGPRLELGIKSLREQQKSFD
jgi:ABC-type Fe3+-hydroxamate transport system substrate-binding protein